MIDWLRKYVITEPILFFVVFASELSFFANFNLYLQKACRNNSSSAPDLGTPCDDEKRGSDYVTTVFNSFLIPNLLVALIFTIFASTYSDLTRKRKAFIVLPLIGQLLRQVVSVTQTIFWSWSPLSGIILDSVANLSFGGVITLFNFVYAYLYDKTTNENRLTRVTLQSVMRNAGTLLAKICGGFLLHRFGFLVTFAVCFVLNSLCLISTLIFVKDDPVPEECEINLRHIFSLNRIRETFVLIAFPKKPRKCVVSIWLLLAINSMVYFLFFGEGTVIYLYFRERFHWDEEKFGVFSCYRSGSTIVGSVLCSLLLSKWLKIPEGIVGAFAALWSTFAVIGFYYAREEWQLYLVPLFDILQGLAMSTYLSQIGRFFTEREFGRLNSMKMIFMTIGSTSAVPVYSQLYRSTRDTHPNAFFLLSAFLGILISVMYGITFFLSRDVRIYQIKEVKNQSQNLSTN